MSRTGLSSIGETYGKPKINLDIGILYVKWEPPPLGVVRLNTNGASKEGDTAGCGGVLRGCNGEWLRGRASPSSWVIAALMWPSFGGFLRSCS